MNLILASSSPYRKALLERLHLPFVSLSPDVDETPKPNEPHDALVVRLAKEKALKGAEGHPDAISIGSDTIASLEGALLCKPITYERAVEQLYSMSGKRVEFLTGVCVYSAITQESYCDIGKATVQFKTLSQDMIKRYLDLEKPFQSSGSFKSETSACALIVSNESDDPTSIVGLPLSKLCCLLEKAGVRVL